MEFSTSKLAHLLLAAKNASAVQNYHVTTDFGYDVCLAYRVNVTLTTNDGLYQEFKFEGSVENLIGPLEATSQKMISTILHTLHAHGADWLPDYLKDNVPEEISS